MFTWTDDPYQTMWGHLRLLSHEHNARQLLSGKLGKQRYLAPPGPDLLDRKAAQVSYCILQAHEYYKAAEAVTIHTSPLLYFYGMLSLAKAVIVANDPVKLLDDVKYHGLKYDRASGRASTLEDRTALLSGGVFDELTGVICNFRYPRGAVFRLKDVLSISPELAQVYELYYGEPSRTLYSYAARVLSSDPYLVELWVTVPDASDAFEHIPELAEFLEPAQSLVHGQAVRLTPKPGVLFPKDLIKEYLPVVGGKYVVGGLLYACQGSPSSRYLTPPLADYIAMYILSDCVRYQQDLWGSIVQGKTTGALGLVDLFIAVSKRRYPNLILDQLFGERFEYGSPGRLM
jgi:hypothetical protein